MTKYYQVFTTVLVFFSLTACSSPPEVSAVPQTVPQSLEKVDAHLGEVVASIAPLDERQGYMAPDAAALIPIWQTGVADALERSGVFMAGSAHRVNVDVRIIRLDHVQNNDLSVTTTAIAAYRVIDAKTQQVLWIRGISSSSTVAYQEMTVQVTRERLSLNRAIQNNITQFVTLYGHGQRESTPAAPSELRLRQSK